MHIELHGTAMNLEVVLAPRFCGDCVSCDELDVAHRIEVTSNLVSAEGYRMMVDLNNTLHGCDSGADSCKVEWHCCDCCNKASFEPKCCGSAENDCEDVIADAKDTDGGTTALQHRLIVFFKGWQLVHRWPDITHLICNVCTLRFDHCKL